MALMEFLSEHIYASCFQVFPSLLWRWKSDMLFKSTAGQILIFYLYLHSRIIIKKICTVHASICL